MDLYKLTSYEVTSSYLDNIFPGAKSVAIGLESPKPTFSKIRAIYFC